MKELQISRQRARDDSGSRHETLIRIDDQGIIQYADPLSFQVLGYDPQSLHHQPLTQLAASPEDDPLNPVHRDRLNQGHPLLLTFRHRDGFYFTAKVSVRVALSDEDEPTSASISTRGSEPLDARLLPLTEKAGQLGIWELDVETNQMTWSEGLYRLFDMQPGSPITPEHALFFFQHQQNRVRALLRRCIRSGEPFSVDLELLTARQRTRPIRLSGQALRHGEQITAIAGTMIDLSERLSHRAVRNEAEQVLKGMMAISDDLLMAVDPTLRIIAVNDAMVRRFEEIFHVRPRVGQDLNQILAAFPEQRHVAQRLWSKGMERDRYTVEMPLLGHGSDPQPVYEFRYQSLRDDQGHLIGAVHLARDITRHVPSTDQEDYLGRYDPMTGLLNRREFLRRLRHTQEKDHEESSCHALLYLDLDRFSHFNQTAGAGACDRYLRELTAMLKARTRQRDSLARVAGDTFGLILDECPESRARKVAENLLEQIRDFELEWQGHRLQTSASAGLVPFTHDRPKPDADALLALSADLCQTAKDAGRDRIHVYRHDRDEVSDSQAQRLLSQLRECIRNDQLTLHYQAMKPIASATWGEHIEILARVAQSDGEALWLPNEFLPIAERFDLARDIDRQVIRKALKWLDKQPLLEPRLKTCSFNLSLASVQDEEFPAFIETAIESLPFPPEVFAFEIRERDATQYADSVTVFCETMHRIGCRVTLDGAGASVQSYALAGSLPVDMIKLDQSLIRNMDSDPVQQVMVEALHRIGEAAGKTTIAPFIEDDDCLRRLRTLGVHFGQGFRIARPRPLETLAPVDPTGRFQSSV